MDILGWTLVVLLFAVGMAGAVYPVLPGALAIYGAFFVYGFFFGWSEFGLWFWTIQTAIVVVIFVADYAVSALGVKRFGGGRASVIGSVVGLIVGPFVIPIPFLGLLVGPFAGAVVGELIAGSKPMPAVKAGVGSLVGLLASTVAKFVLQAGMIVVFLVWII
ncbi:DUF456 domain-containing protein [Paenibacillus sp.]|uniref:DUF456 domain-containing protein n=1 Tax=Paenibacillus sp. TaxID=58172 RepID=UPI002D48A3D3|nr:DUF456 family protein [Paenibacillus sp.]HZG57581.1 DUF456 family protein [Paenibacillus sp.]